MERINQFRFFEVGQKLHKLREFVGDEVIAKDAFFPVWEARDAVDSLLSGDPMDLTVSKQCAMALRQRLQGIISDHYQFTTDDGEAHWKLPGNDTPAISSWHWDQLLRALDEFEMVFREEMREASTYRVPDRGIFNTAKLVEAADLSFPAELLPTIPAKTREDWKSAGRCLAFNLLSASGFHVARAVEGTLEAYYQMASGKTNTLRGWNDYIKALETAKASKAGKLEPSDKVISELKQMKDDYRNPIVHPRVVLTDADSRMLFANGESLIIAMAQEMEAARPKGLAAINLADVLRLGAELSNAAE